MKEGTKGLETYPPIPYTSLKTDIGAVGQNVGT